MLNIKVFFKGGINGLKRVTNLGNYWYWLDDNAVEEIDILSMVYPLRYDILIRKKFFEFYVSNKELYLRDVSAFMCLARETQYYEWFCRIIAVREKYNFTKDINVINKHYEERIRESINIYESIIAKGFDCNYPIIPHTGEKILPAISGRTSVIKYHMGDGCHRLSCLIALGYEKLPKEYFRIKVFNKYVPLDNTIVLSKFIDLKKEWLKNVIELRNINIKSIRND